MYVKSPNTKHNAYSCTYSSQPRDKCMKQDLKNAYSMQQTLADTGSLFLKHTMEDNFGDQQHLLDLNYIDYSFPEHKKYTFTNMSGTTKFVEDPDIEGHRTLKKCSIPI